VGSKKRNSSNWQFHYLWTANGDVQIQWYIFLGSGCTDHSCGFFFAGPYFFCTSKSDRRICKSGSAGKKFPGHYRARDRANRRPDRGLLRQPAAAVEEADLYGMYVATHAHGAEGIKRAIRAGVRSVEHGSLMDDESIAMMAESGTYLVADIYNGDYINEIGTRDGWSANTMRKNRETTDAQREGFTKAVAAGVRIAYGTDSGVYPHRDAANQLPYMVRYGMTPMQGIQAATIVAAECMGWEDRVGSITPGKFADFVAVKADPITSGLESLRSVDAVIKGGELVPVN